MIAALQRRKLNMFKWREGMLSPRAFVRGNPARVKFAAENTRVTRVTVWRLYIRKKTACDVKVWHPKLKSFNDEKCAVSIVNPAHNGCGRSHVDHVTAGTYCFSSEGAKLKCRKINYNIHFLQI